jgi:hypothetical protein
MTKPKRLRQHQRCLPSLFRNHDSLVHNSGSYTSSLNLTSQFPIFRFWVGKLRLTITELEELHGNILDHVRQGKNRDHLHILLYKLNLKNSNLIIKIKRHS